MDFIRGVSCRRSTRPKIGGNRRLPGILHPVQADDLTMPMNIERILAYLPHRYPMLLVDRILEIEPGKSIKGLKCVTFNEQFFQGHYPGMPVMPGVLIIEAMAQVGAVLLLSDPKLGGLVPLIGSIDNVKLRRPVIPGDRLVSVAEIAWIKGVIGKVIVSATVDDQRVAEAEIICKLVPREE
ncbi:MAG: 3-hydroxyacyl-ACP dehydratase FabZ [Fimbriimonadaceae bacterium]|nr:3-hydroxyacyl-ACP dehydratase FabZ [Fimbriimonadaceae bacterium]